MDTERIHGMIETLTERAKSEMDNNIECVDTCEMGKVVDMIKDLSEALYYRKIVNAMDDVDSEDVVRMLGLKIKSGSETTNNV